MRVPTYEQQAQYQPRQIQKFQVADNTPDMRLHITADMLGGAQAKELGQVGQNLQRAGALGAHAYAEWQDTKAQAAFNEMQSSLNDKLYGPDGIFNLKGEAGIDAPNKAQQAIAEASREFQKKAGNSLGQGYFKMREERLTQQLMPRAMQHAAMEKQNFEISTHISTATLAYDEALKNADNPEVFSLKHAEGLQAISLAGRARGQSAEEIEGNRRKYSSQLYMGKVQGLLTAGKIGEAQKIAGSGFLMGEDGLRAGGMIRSEQKRAEAEARANAAEARIGVITRETDSMFGQFGTDIGASYEYIREKYKNDPKTRYELEGGISRRVGMEEAAQNKSRKIQLEQGKNTALDAIGEKDATPKSVSDIILQAPPEIQPELIRAARNRFPSQDVVVSDADKLLEAKEGIETGKYKDEKEFRRLFMPYIASNELSALEQRVTKNRDKASDSSLRSSFNTLLREYNIEGLASSADMTPAAYSKSVWDNFVTEAFDRDFQTAQEKRQYMQEYLRRVSLTKSGKIFGDVWPSKEEVPEYAARPLRAEGYAEEEPERPQGLPNTAKWDAAKAGWVYQGKIVYAAKVVQK